MSEVSEAGQHLLTQLVAWEFFDRQDLDPRVLLRQASLADLSVVQENIRRSGLDESKFVSATLVGLELHYRLGHLGGDWDFKREGKDVTLLVRPKTPLKFIPLHLVCGDPASEV
jgi:hypothetical protein